jgi:hypothetical protein
VSLQVPRLLTIEQKLPAIHDARSYGLAIEASILPTMKNLWQLRALVLATDVQSH